MAKINFKVPPLPSTRAAVDVARSFIAAGIPVFPCREEESEGVDYATGEIITFAEKAPYTSDGLKGATKSPRIINIWFGDRYQSAVVGIPTGESLGAWVLDLDRHGDRDGHVWLAEMEAIHGDLPETARAKTANGGTHIFFTHVDGIRNRAAIAEGVDSRGEGGYIVSPGSVMADGRTYSWVDWTGEGLPPIADTPAWLLDLVKAKEPVIVPQTRKTEYTYQPSTGRSTIYVDRAVEAELKKLAWHGEGGRGWQLYASAAALGEFVAAGELSRADAEAGLWEAARSCGVAQKDGDRATADRIKRGLEKTQNTPRDLSHVETTGGDYDNTPINRDAIDSIIKSAKTKKAAKAAAADNDNVASEKPEKAAIAPTPELANMDAQATPKKRERFELTWFDQIEEGKPKEEFIKKVLGESEFTTISGLPGTGKSVIVTDMACHVAKGMDWHGRKVRQGLVIYVAAERKKLTERRMMAFRKKHDVHDVPLLVIGGRLDFTKDLNDAKALIGAIKEAEEATEMKCVWVIIDTLTRVFGAGDQNASKDMSRFVQSCDEILAETKAHVTAIHHSAWSGERGKGAIDLDGAVDASFMVKKEHGKYKLVCDGTNDGEEGDILAFTMESVEIGIDEEGEPTTAPVVVPTDGGGPGEKLASAIKGHNARCFEVLRELLDSTGGTVDTPHFPQDAIVVLEDAWRQAVYDDDKDAKQTTLTQRYSRAYKFLKDSGQIDHIGQWVFIK